MYYYRINEIKLKIGEDISNIPKHIVAKLGNEGKGISIDSWRIVKESIDARDKGNLRMVYSVDFAITPEGRRLSLSPGGQEEYQYPVAGSNAGGGADCSPDSQAADKSAGRYGTGGMALKTRPVICGFGPCGMFAGLLLARLGYRPVILERGSAMEKRTKDVSAFWEKGLLDAESNVQFGEGGAGTFSDGKLTTNIKDKRISFILKEFVKAGAPEHILYRQKPHIGTDIIRRVVVNIRKEIIALGGEILFDTRLDTVIIEDSRIKAIKMTKKCCNETEIIQAECLILATGHSARDTVRELYSAGVDMVQKPFSMGVRIEHLQSLINKSQYGNSEEAKKLPPAEYKLNHRCKNGRGVYTFCMCPGGEVIVASSQKGGVVTNGMSYSRRDGKYANSALLADVRTDDFPDKHPLSGLKLQEEYEGRAFRNGGGRYTAPSCTWQEFAENSGEAAAKVRDSIPGFVAEAIVEAMPFLGRKLKGFDSPDARLTAVESRSSSPVRIPRDEGLTCNIGGIYPGGEGAGYAGGIVSAAVDGMRCAEEIIKNCQRPQNGDIQ